MAKILVVDDVEDNVKLLGFTLEDDGHDIIGAGDGVECLQKARQHHPDLILLDVMMPVLGGVDTLQHLKGDPELKSIPVIMLSAKDGDDWIVKSLDIGAHDYIAKPFVYPILSARIRSALRLRESQSKLAEANANLSRLASQDPLTEAYNRRHFFEISIAEFVKARRFNRPLAVIMLDIDHFKSINDTFGHSSGDRALVELTRQCRAIGRQSDIFGRIGGEEFALCCPDTDCEGARFIAERLRKAVEELVITSQDCTIKFTISLGVSDMNDGDADFSYLLKRADQLLYKAKHKGRNCTVAG